MKKTYNKNKEMHHIHDKSYKDLYSKKEIALDLFKCFKWSRNKSYKALDKKHDR